MPRERPNTSAEDGLDAPATLDHFLGADALIAERLYAKAGAARWNLTPAQFAAALRRSAAHHFSGVRPTEAELAGYLESLHLEDLALACACSDANEQAWEHFVGNYRQGLYAAARAIIGTSPAGMGEAEARDLADSLYAELYLGSAKSDLAPSREHEADAAMQAEPHSAESSGAHQARRHSLFDYFHGRSKLSTWLRAVLAQRHVDGLRTCRRTESLEERDTDAQGCTPLRSSPTQPDPDRARYLGLLQAALLKALAALPPRDRLRLSCYYVQELTLAQTGRLLGEHEATASRHLERTRSDLRKQVERALRSGSVSVGGEGPVPGLSDAQIHLCFEYATEEWPFDLTRALGAPAVVDSAAGNPRGPALSVVPRGQNPGPKRGPE